MAQATAAPGSAHSAVAKENKKAIQARNLRTGLLFTAPALIVLAIFVFYPAIKTFITSLTSDRINRAGKFVGFGNYVKLFQSADFWTDVKNTLVYAVAYAPIVVIVALAFALLLNRKDLKFVGFFRTCMFLPFVISLTVAAIAWQFILSPSLGLVPYWIQQLTGIAHVDLLGTRETAMAAIVFITVWKTSATSWSSSSQVCRASPPNCMRPLPSTAPPHGRSSVTSPFRRCARPSTMWSSSASSVPSRSSIRSSS